MRRATSFQLHPGKTNRNLPMAYLTEAKIRERPHEPLSATHGIPAPVFGHRRLPTGKRRLLAGEATQARPFHRHLAPPCRRASQTCLSSCPGDAPFGCPSVVAAWAGRPPFGRRFPSSRPVPRSNRRDPRGKAETYRNAPSYSQALRSLRARDSRWNGSDQSVHGVAFPAWNKPPRASQLKASNAAPAKSGRRPDRLRRRYLVEQSG